jgi:hypothetical protein
VLELRGCSGNIKGPHHLKDTVHPRLRAIRHLLLDVTLGVTPRLDVEAQVEMESNVCKQFIIF